jgi:hypothetical protein
MPNKDKIKIGKPIDNVRGEEIGTFNTDVATYIQAGPRSDDR